MIHADSCPECGGIMGRPASPVCVGACLGTQRSGDGKIRSLEQRIEVQRKTIETYSKTIDEQAKRLEGEDEGGILARSIREGAKITEFEGALRRAWEGDRAWREAAGCATPAELDAACSRLADVMDVAHEAVEQLQQENAALRKLADLNHAVIARLVGVDL